MDSIKATKMEVYNFQTRLSEMKLYIYTHSDTTDRLIYTLTVLFFSYLPPYTSIESR